MPTGENSGDNDTTGLTMEEKLLLWQQAKLQKQRTVKSDKDNTCGGSRHSSGGNAMSNGSVKRRLATMGSLSNRTAITTTETSGRTLSTHKKPRVSPDCRRNVPVPASTSFTSPSPAVKVKPRLPVSTRTPKSSPEARCQEGSPQCPIVIDDGSDTGMSLTSPSSAVKVIPSCPVSAKSARTPKSASVTRNGEGSAQSPIFIEVDSGSPVNQPPPPPTRVVKNMLPVPKKNDTEKPTTLSQSQSHQISVVPKSTSEPRHNNRESPISVSQPMPIRNSVFKQKGNMVSKHNTDVWKGNPAFDKENQNLPASVEKSPELLAKNLVRVAIGFEKKHRLATAFGIFKRANHILPKESTKLTERLGRLQEECPTAVNQAPPQELSTTAYMVKVLERDLMSVLNHGTTNELTQLHAIGVKRAELVLEKRPYQQLEELRRVPGMSANVIARLHQHHTNWENHQ